MIKDMWKILPIICALLLAAACSPTATNETSEATVPISLFEPSLTPVTETEATATEHVASVKPSATPTIEPEPTMPAPMHPLAGLLYP